MMNSFPHIRRLIINSGGANLNSCRNYEEDEKMAAEALLMLSTTRPQSPPQKSGYKCSLCEKSFGSHQALGGHMTSHRKKTAAGKNGEMISMASASSSAGKSDVVSDTGDYCVEKVHDHKCCACGATFFIGEQLGEHKRNHCQQSSENQSDDTERRTLELFNHHLSGEVEPIHNAGVTGGTIATVYPDLNLDLKLSL